MTYCDPLCVVASLPGIHHSGFTFISPSSITYFRIVLMRYSWRARLIEPMCSIDVYLEFLRYNFLDSWYDMHYVCHPFLGILRVSTAWYRHHGLFTNYSTLLIRAYTVAYRFTNSRSLSSGQVDDEAWSRSKYPSLTMPLHGSLLSCSFGMCFSEW